MNKAEQITLELKTLSADELDEVLTFIGYLKFRSATAADTTPEMLKLDRSDA